MLLRAREQALRSVKILIRWPRQIKLLLIIDGNYSRN